MKQRVLILVAVLFAMTASSSALAGNYVGLSYVDPGSGFAIQIGSGGYGYGSSGYYGGYYGGYYPRYRYERRHYRGPVRSYGRSHRDYRHYDRHYRGHYRHYDRGYRSYRHDRRHRYDPRWRY